MHKSGVPATLATSGGTKDGDRIVGEGQSLRLSALFSAMMESNAILRRDIDEMDPGTVSETDLQSEPDEPQVYYSRSLPASLFNYHTWTSDLSYTAALRDGSRSETDDDSEGTEESDSEDERPLGSGARPEVRVPLSITSFSSSSSDESSDSASTSTDEPDSSSNLFALPGESVIESMWENFSVENYPSPVRERKSNIKTQPQKAVWSRRVTIPEPFAMTIRDEGRPKRPKSRAFIAVEQRRLEREMQEAIECQKKFRALPVPATTYVSMDEIRRGESMSRLESEKQPQPFRLFSFMKRDEEKQLEKQRKLAEMQNTKQDVVFKARLAPESVLSPRVSEELKEKETYRRILIKVRSQEMLARAQLPKNMQKEEEKREHRRKMRMKERQNQIDDKHPFCPKIKQSIPDHAELYSKFQQQIVTKRDVRPATTPNPFVLRTSSSPLLHTTPNQEQSEQEESSSIAASSSLSSSLPSNSKNYSHRKSKVRWSRTHYAPRGPPTVQMTEAAKLRQSVSEQKLAECAEREAEEEEARRQKRDQQKVLRSRIIQQVQSCDHTTLLHEKQRERMAELRNQDQARRTAYCKELKAMKQRLEARPLVFEQASRDAARRAAEEKYREALKKAGLSENEIQFLDKQIAT